MSHKLEFDHWLNELFQTYNIKLKNNKLFYFLTYKEYSDKLYEDMFIIFEDWWILKPEVVKSKIKSILKISERIFARQCTVKKINKPEADLFLNKNHLYGTVNSKIKYGLFYKDILYGTATFAGQRQFKKGRSVELLRYCSKNDFTIVGGLDKLLQAYISDYKPNTMMTYIDLDWGNGNAFIKLGFEAKEIKPAMTFYTSKKSGLRIPEKYFQDFDNINDYVKINNKGSIKMVKTLGL